jgi:hypothetical protein
MNRSAVSASSALIVVAQSQCDESGGLSFHAALFFVNKRSGKRRHGCDQDRDRR